MPFKVMNFIAANDGNVQKSGIPKQKNSEMELRSLSKFGKVIVTEQGASSPPPINKPKACATESENSAGNKKRQIEMQEHTVISAPPQVLSI